MVPIQDQPARLQHLKCLLGHHHACQLMGVQQFHSFLDKPLFVQAQVAALFSLFQGVQQTSRHTFRGRSGYSLALREPVSSLKGQQPFLEHFIRVFFQKFLRPDPQCLLQTDRLAGTDVQRRKQCDDPSCASGL